MEIARLRSEFVWPSAGPWLLSPESDDIRRNILRRERLRSAFHFWVQVAVSGEPQLQRVTNHPLQGFPAFAALHRPALIQFQLQTKVTLRGEAPA